MQAQQVTLILNALEIGDTKQANKLLTKEIEKNGKKM